MPSPVKPAIKASELERVDISEGMLLDLGSADGLVPVLAIREHPVPDGTRA